LNRDSARLAATAGQGISGCCPRRSSGQCERQTGRQRRETRQVQSLIPSRPSQVLRQRSIIPHAPTTVTEGADRIAVRHLGSSRKDPSCLPGEGLWVAPPPPRLARAPAKCDARTQATAGATPTTRKSQCRHDHRRSARHGATFQMTQARAPLIDKKISANATVKPP